MKRFLLKFIVLFILLDGYIAWYAITVYPNLCGEMDNLGQIPFGSEYTLRMDSVYPINDIFIQNIYADQIDSTPAKAIYTIGDSFSAQDKLGYQQFLGESLGDTIYNILHHFEISAEDLFCQLINSGLISPGSTVIVESVERSMIKRLCEIKLDGQLSQEPPQRITNGNGKMDLLNGAASKIRMTLGYKNPIVRYKTSIDLFSHSTIHNELYIFNSKWDSYEYGQDGDLLFQNIDSQAYDIAFSNLYRLKELAHAKNIRFMYLIAADKYDVYEPFINKKHPRNPTLDNCPDEPWVVNTKPILQEKAHQGIKDIYRINDTHWSPIGAKLVANYLKKKYDNLAQ